MSTPNNVDSVNSIPDEELFNNASTFVAPAHSSVQNQSENTAATVSNSIPTEQEYNSERLVPTGLKALYDVCSKLYPDQPNPLQVTTRLKYWLGGQDPLDYISMYWNPGSPIDHVPPHWHYVSFGLSDLHGDGRVHPPPAKVNPSVLPPTASGYGFELTFRLAAEPGAPPPLWPAALLQALARYVFTTGNKLCAGDHISWHAPLDGPDSNSRLRHLLVFEDSQLSSVDTPYGIVAFLQMVGCTCRELRAAQRSSGFDVLKQIADEPNSGGRWCVCVLGRPSVPVRACGRAAAQLAGVSAPVRWQLWQTADRESPQSPSNEYPAPGSLTPSVQRQIIETLQRGLTAMSEDKASEGHMSTDSFQMSSIERALPEIPELMQSYTTDEGSVQYYEGVHVMLNAEGASLLPLAIHGRICHGRHFTWRQGSRAVTLLSPIVVGAVATVHNPYAAKGTWLQILIPKELADDILDRLSGISWLSETDESDSESERDVVPVLPLTLCWPKYRLKITVLPDHEI